MKVRFARDKDWGSASCDKAYRYYELYVEHSRSFNPLGYIRYLLGVE